MTKEWSFADFEFALDSAWSAFESTLKAHEVTTEEIKKFKYLADSSLVKVDDYFAQSITWEEE